jgi:hypothetical protein
LKLSRHTRYDEKASWRVYGIMRKEKDLTRSQTREIKEELTDRSASDIIVGQRKEARMVPTHEEYVAAMAEDAKLAPRVAKIKMMIAQYEAGLLTNRDLLDALWTVTYDLEV